MRRVDGWLRSHQRQTGMMGVANLFEEEFEIAEAVVLSIMHHDCVVSHKLSHIKHAISFDHLINALVFELFKIIRMTNRSIAKNKNVKWVQMRSVETNRQSNERRSSGFPKGLKPM